MKYHLASLLLSFIETSSDPARDSLVSDSATWFRGVWISGLIVAIGCALELWDTAFTMRKWWRKRKNLPELVDDDGSWRHPMAAVGLFLVIGGIVSETSFEILDSGTETSIRSHDEQFLRETDGKFGQAKQSAEDASKAAELAEASAAQAGLDADTASSKSTEAIISAGNATNLAKDARQEASSFEEKIASATKTATEAENHLADAKREVAQAEAELQKIRSLRSINDSAKLAVLLKPFAGTLYALNVFNDSESIELARKLRPILDEAKWVPYWPTEIPVMGSPYVNIFPEGITFNCVGTGVQVLVQVPPSGNQKLLQAGEILRKELAPRILPLDERNVGNSVLSRQGVPTIAIICVGQKP
jgi:hypothetical protein